jgi:ATP-dependent RNA helicase DeaD
MNQKAQKHKKEDLMRKQFENSGGEPGMVRLFVNIGKSKKVQPRDFVGAIAGESKIPGKAIGAIDILNNFSFVEVPMEYGKKVLSAMDNNSIKGYEVNMEVANIR